MRSQSVRLEAAHGVVANDQTRAGGAVANGSACGVAEAKTAVAAKRGAARRTNAGAKLSSVNVGGVAATEVTQQPSSQLQISVCDLAGARPWLSADSASAAGAAIVWPAIWCMACDIGAAADCPVISCVIGAELFVPCGTAAVTAAVTEAALLECIAH